MASNGDNDYYSYDDSDANDDCGYDPNCSDDEDYLPDTVDLQSEKFYTVLKEEEIKQRQNDDITEISSVLSIPRKAATILLCSYKWTVSEVMDSWFANVDEVCSSVGLVLNEENKKQKGFITCNICFTRLGHGNCVSAGCGHSFCKMCYSNWLRVSIDDGIGCLLLRCPEPKCRVVVDRDLINSLKELPDEHKSKYERFLLRSYVEESRMRKWCPAPGCKNAVEFTEICLKNWDVVCDCSFEFCWNCQEESHSPVDCATVLEWEKKNTNESENVSWIHAYTKPCPKCKSPIEKNHGCDHMTCKKPCNYEFCWLCLGDWRKHCSSACNSFQSGQAQEGNKIRKLAQSMLQRYAHYYERWNGNHRSRRIARADLYKFKTVHSSILINNYKKQTLRGIEEAWLQIIECRRVLRWSYVYGYYLPESEKARKNLFEYLQGQAESALGRLHEYAEQELQPFIAENPAELDEFNKYYSQLGNLTRVTRNFFGNLVKGLQNGLEVGDCSC
ncbi:probable E3 ubiquitin-protein ligase ARI8 [Euphorbia lathyris]|uniref:probable E3 ubiquitin-protein ligase ARI8 n=1 Tax=Euphorbia lathyris TaxID=212925 RepID=UPI00331402FF